MTLRRASWVWDRFGECNHIACIPYRGHHIAGYESRVGWIDKENVRSRRTHAKVGYELASAFAALSSIRKNDSDNLRLLHGCVRKRNDLPGIGHKCDRLVGSLLRNRAA